jgi:hypothetical protein
MERELIPDTKINSFSEGVGAAVEIRVSGFDTGRCVS